jgi:hypothetical protein
MPTPAQLRMLHSGVRKLKWNDKQYRTVLLNVAGVNSSKLLDQAGFEDVMALLEDSGFDQHPAGSSYWRDKVRARSVVCGPRMYHLIKRLAKECRYDLGALCLRFSAGGTDEPALLKPREAWNLIEGMKAMNFREAQEDFIPRDKTKAGRQGSLFAGMDAKPQGSGPHAGPAAGGTEAATGLLPPRTDDEYRIVEDDDVPF